MVNGASIGELRKKVTKLYDLIGTAYHEAGHTIFGLLCCMKVVSVYVYEEKKLKRIYGYTNNTIPLLDSIEDTLLFNKLLENEIGFSYSGFLAEKYHFKIISGSDQVPMFIKNDSYNDMKELNKLIKQYNLAPPGKKRYAYKQKIARKTLRTLQENWSDVSLIAHNLFSHKRLSHQDLQEILTSKSDNKKFWKEQFKLISQIYDNGPLDENLLRTTLCA
jgi:hypothetical protein